MMTDLIQQSRSDSARGFGDSNDGMTAHLLGGSAFGIHAGTAVSTGENRLQVTTGISTGVTNAAVRMHDVPVFGNFWAYCPKTKTHHFQHRKVAT